MNLFESCRIRFLDRYNPTRSVEEAIRKSLNAAVQHNLLYSRQAALIERAKVRTYWGDCLREISKEFRADVSIESYESMVEALKCEMNSHFGDTLENNSPHGRMFRISHSQKSISVFIKHLWCLGEVVEPLICPIDRIVLSETMARTNKDVAWGYVNTIEEHRVKFRYVQNAAEAEHLSVAMWELLKFSK